MEIQWISEQIINYLLQFYSVDMYTGCLFGILHFFRIHRSAAIACLFLLVCVFIAFHFSSRLLPINQCAHFWFWYNNDIGFPTAIKTIIKIELIFNKFCYFYFKQSRDKKHFFSHIKGNWIIWCSHSLFDRYHR